jgi:hypothetical protein
MEITAAKLIKNFGMEETQQKLLRVLVMAQDLVMKVHAAMVMITRSVQILKDAWISMEVRC